MPHEVRGPHRPVAGLALLVALILREGINGLLPAGNIGGELVGFRLLADSGVDGVTSAASPLIPASL